MPSEITESGQAVWLKDPGINGVYNTRPEGTEVRKFDAPKATLRSYIIKGMLNRKLPWGLVLFGIIRAIVLELCGVSSPAWALPEAYRCGMAAPSFRGSDAP